MNANGIGVAASLVFGGSVLFYLAWTVARWRRGRRRAAGVPDAGAPASDPVLRRLELRMEEIEAGQTALARRVEDENDETRLKEMAGSLVGIIRDKNATLETALAGLDQLRGRIGTLEKIGDLAEARGLFERLGTRIEALETTQAAAQAAAEARFAALAENPFAEISAQLTGLYAQKDAAVETVFARLAPLEAKLAETQTALGRLDPPALLDRVDGRLEAVQGRLAALESPEANPFGEISEQLTRLYAQKDAAVETVFARLAPLEAKLAETQMALGRLDPQAALDRLGERLEALQGRLAVLEDPGENPFAGIPEQLTRLYAQKDAAVEAVLSRLGPLEGRLAALEGTSGRIEALEQDLARRDPRAALDDLAGRIAAMQAQIAALEAPGENPFGEISAQLTRLYAQKDAAVETVFARLTPLEAKLAETQTAVGRLDPQAALDRFAERLAAGQAELQGQIDALRSGENPFAGISEQLTRLYAQKDAAVETVFARLTPLEAKLAETQTALGRLDPQAALDRFAERLAAGQAELQGQIDALRSGENPFAGISEQLTRLYAQKDAAVETVFARLAPLEAKLAETKDELEAGLAARDRDAERLEAVQGRLLALEKPGENPFAEISAQLTRLYAQKDAAVEAVLSRLTPLEAKLAELEAELETGLGRLDPQAAVARLGERLETLQGRLLALEAPGENPFAEISAQLTRLYAQKDATVEMVFARLAPLETKLVELDAGRLAPLEARLAAADPAIEGLAVRVETLHRTQGEMAAGLAVLRAAGGEAVAPIAGIAEQLTRLQAQKEAGLAAVLQRLEPLEARLAALEAGPDAEAGEARIGEIAAELAAARAAAEQTARFADRLTLLEASLPRPAPRPRPAPLAGPAAEPPAAAAGGLEEIWRIPRIVSTHQR